MGLSRPTIARGGYSIQYDTSAVKGNFGGGFDSIKNRANPGPVLAPGVRVFTLTGFEPMTRSAVRPNHRGHGSESPRTSANYALVIITAGRRHKSVAPQSYSAARKSIFRSRELDACLTERLSPSTLG